MSAFLALAAQCDFDVDGLFAEPFDFLPFVQPIDTTASEAPDLDRTPLTLNAVYDDPAEPVVESNAWDARQARRPGMVSGGPVIEISLAEQNRLAALGGPPFQARVGDRFVRQSTGATYRVVSAPPVSPSGLMKLKVNVI